MDFLPFCLESNVSLLFNSLEIFIVKINNLVFGVGRAKRLTVDAAIVFVCHGNNAHFSLSVMVKIDALRRLGQNERREEKNRM